MTRTISFSDHCKYILVVWELDYSLNVTHAHYSNMWAYLSPTHPFILLTVLLHLCLSVQLVFNHFPSILASELKVYNKGLHGIGK